MLSLTEKQHSDQLSSVNSALKDIESYLKLIDRLQFNGSDSGTVESMRQHFNSVYKQLLGHLEDLSVVVITKE